mmetsp:Transcript_11026/g.45007  ORF Transcript_11026/g.45007 Transcript_11026/m.45007 type:complete len:447 (-) Transcript_11026:186-1526(-)
MLGRVGPVELVGHPQSVRNALSAARLGAGPRCAHRGLVGAEVTHGRHVERGKDARDVALQHPVVVRHAVDENREVLPLLQRRLEGSDGLLLRAGLRGHHEKRRQGVSCLVFVVLVLALAADALDHPADELVGRAHLHEAREDTLRPAARHSAREEVDQLVDAVVRLHGAPLPDLAQQLCQLLLRRSRLGPRVRRRSARRNGLLNVAGHRQGLARRWHRQAAAKAPSRDLLRGTRASAHSLRNGRRACDARRRECATARRHWRLLARGWRGGVAGGGAARSRARHLGRHWQHAHGHTVVRNGSRDALDVRHGARILLLGRSAVLARALLLLLAGAAEVEGGRPLEAAALALGHLVEPRRQWRRRRRLARGRAALGRVSVCGRERRARLSDRRAGDGLRRLSNGGARLHDRLARLVDVLLHAAKARLPQVALGRRGRGAVERVLHCVR